MTTRGGHGKPSPPPGPARQVRFLTQIQSLLGSGRFTATYKFALLHAIADLCVELGEDSGDELTLPVERIAERFVELYSRQAVPYPGRTEARVLKQNKGRQARVVTVLEQEVRRYGRGAADDLSRRALAEIDETVRDQPLWKLQTVGGGRRLEFLYENTDDYRAREITLRPGIAYCFRAFHGFVVSLIRGRWEAWIRRHNADLLDEKTDLAEFLFGSERRDLTPFRQILIRMSGRRCFYTGRSVSGSLAVDHFVPWARYPSDLGHNFVLASPAANSRKSDSLAAEPHLERWLRFCLDHHRTLDECFRAGALPHSLPSSLAIAEWSYSAAERADDRVWLRGDEYEPLSPGWRGLFADAWRELRAY